MVASDCCPGGIFLQDGTRNGTPVQIRLAENTPYLIDYKDGITSILWNGETVARVLEFEEQAAYYNRVFEDGTPYPHEGTLQFRDVTVDSTTGSFTLRIVVPNPQHLLLPGMFVRAVVQEGISGRAILVPQQAVTRTPKGEPFAMVVDDAGMVQQRMLELNRPLDNKWLVSMGLNAGERVIVEGVMNVRPGAMVRDASLNVFQAGSAGSAPMSRGPQGK
jgi:RND family efflux transporter MFP subunit